MAIKKAKINDTIYDVITEKEFESNPEFYKTSPVAIDGDDGYLYPIRTNPTDSRPGFVDATAMHFFNIPRGIDCPIYSDMNLIDFSKASSIKDVIESQARLANAERSILTTIDNVFTPPENPDDTPEMSLLKQAIRDKHIDLDKYESRFGANYNNDKRLIKKSNITFGKLRNICKALDIRATLTMEDANPDVPNPMGRKIDICLTDGFDNSEEEESK